MYNKGMNDRYTRNNMIFVQPVFDLARYNRPLEKQLGS